jgi:pyridoxal 5'-phosphate synthase pdxT subunit
MPTTEDIVKVGVLALQGAFEEHMGMLRKIPNVEAVEIRRPDELLNVDGLVIPGGESTAMRIIAGDEMIKALVDFEKPKFGTCAGSILLARESQTAENSLPSPGLLSSIDVKVCRNYFGRQKDSFVVELKSEYFPEFEGVFIRAPAIVHLDSASCEILASVVDPKTGKELPVAVKNENCLVTCFHPELTDDGRFHEMFADMIRSFKK